MTTTRANILGAIGAAVGLLLAVPGCVQLAHADARITADTKVERVGQPLTDGEMRAISFSAGRILKHVDQAQQAIAKQDKSGALAHIDKGLTLAAIIEQSIPPTTVKSTIKAGKLEYWDEDSVKSLTVPIYQELDTISILAPVAAAKKSAKAGTADKKAPTKAQVEEVEESYTGIELNVADTKTHLENAKEALTGGHFDTASKHLTAIQEEVIIVYAREQGPLADAREDLVYAQVSLDLGRRKDAQRALADASASLSQYEKSGGKHQAEVKPLQAEITALSKELDQSKEGSVEKVKAKIMGWWDRVKRWEARHFSRTESPTKGLGHEGPYENR